MSLRTSPFNKKTQSIGTTLCTVKHVFKDLSIKKTQSIGTTLCIVKHVFKDLSIKKTQSIGTTLCIVKHVLFKDHENEYHCPDSAQR